MIRQPCGNLLDGEPPECVLSRPVPHDCRKVCGCYRPCDDEDVELLSPTWERILRGATHE